MELRKIFLIVIMIMAMYEIKNITRYRVSQLYRTANLCYSLALHRATPYLAGIGLGVLLQQTGKDVTLSKVSLTYYIMAN